MAEVTCDRCGTKTDKYRVVRQEGIMSYVCEDNCMSTQPSTLSVNVADAIKSKEKIG